MKLAAKPVRRVGRSCRTSIIAVSAAVVVAASVSACGASSHRSTGTSGPPSSGGITIVIKDFAFSPADLTVRPGAKVTVRNEDPTTHTATAVAPHDKAFDTGDIAANATATFTAPTTAGPYAYICEIHQFMHGTLTVR